MQIFSPILLILLYVDDFLFCAEPFDFYVVPLVFVASAFGIISKKSLPRTKSRTFFLCFLVGALQFSNLMCRSPVLFELYKIGIQLHSNYVK